jgi:hypothetical protein
LAFPAIAQDVVGTALVDGKRVELLSNNTWRIARAAGAGTSECELIGTLLTFCDASNDWNTSRAAGTDFLRIYRHSSRVYSGIIHDDVGSADGVDLEFLRKSAINIAAVSTGIRSEDVQIAGVVDAEVIGWPGEALTYAILIEGTPFTYQNTFVNSGNHSLQLMNWSLGPDVTDEATQMRESFLGGIRISEDMGE